MEDGINDTTNVGVVDVNRRRRPVPVPLYDDRYDNRYIERPYLRKHELSKIRNNLDELVDIKAELTDKNINKLIDKPKIDNIINTRKNDIKIVSDINSTMNVPDIPIVTSISLPEIKTENKSEPVKSEIKTETIKNETKKEDVKFGLNNLVYNKEIKKIDVVENKQNTDNKNKSKIIKRKVNHMNDEEQQTYNISPEDRRRMRKAEHKEFLEEDETSKAIRKSAEFAEQNRKELEALKKSLIEENAEIRKELKNEFGNRFSDINEKFDKVSGKLEETCTGIECLKKDLANISKNSDLSECPECGQRIVPQLASFCPNCSTKIGGWTEDDGTPIKGWKPNWENKQV